jgi:SAM-dependent methyltransferase
MSDLDRLNLQLRDFYNTDAGYWSEAWEANEEITPERAHLFGFIRPGDRVLDVGCGTCQNGLFIRPDTMYIGCDVSFTALAIATEVLRERRYATVQGESQSLPLAEGSMDVVLSTYALEHFVFPEESLREMWRVCRPGGLVLLAAPAYDDPRYLPSSVTHWPRMRRWQLMVQQFRRQLMRHVRPRRLYFERLGAPRILTDAYQSDFDAVHLVSAREIANFFLQHGGDIVFQRKREPRAVAGAAPARRRVREFLRNLLLRMDVGAYAGLNLQIAVRKPRLPEAPRPPGPRSSP